MEVEEEKAKQLYYSPSKGFLSLPKLWKKIKEANTNLSFNDLKKILEQKEVYQITKQVKRQKSSPMFSHHIHFNQLS